jgi:hypothetical protein
LFRTRKAELDPDATEKLLTTARSNLVLTLDAGTVKEAHWARLSRRSLGASLGGHNAMVSLTRRLIHIERTAERVAALAAVVMKDR